MATLLSAPLRLLAACLLLCSPGVRSHMADLTGLETKVERSLRAFQHDPHKLAASLAKRLADSFFERTWLVVVTWKAGDNVVCNNTEKPLRYELPSGHQVLIFNMLLPRVLDPKPAQTVLRRVPDTGQAFFCKQSAGAIYAETGADCQHDIALGVIAVLREFGDSFPKVASSDPSCVTSKTVTRSFPVLCEAQFRVVVLT